MSNIADKPDLGLSTLRALYHAGSLTPAELVEQLLARAEKLDHPGIWIYRLQRTELQPYLDRLHASSVSDLPLYGVPFVIKDNIDLAGIPTTAGCEAFAYTPEQSAFVVQRLINAGAIPLGKTNLDQFATGLVGTRSLEPWGPCANAYDSDYISGGSSSGSAVAVALGLASFSLGTDTAGSGRVPAAFNNLVGVKPSCGLLSSAGMVPACRSLDTISIFTNDSADAQCVFEQARAMDVADDYSRELQDSVWPALAMNSSFRVAVPVEDQLEFNGCPESRLLFERSIDVLRMCGAEVTATDFSPLLDAAQLLYQGPWVAERAVATASILDHNPDAMHPVVREVISAASKFDARDAFLASYQLQAYRRHAERFFEEFDFALTPTVPGIYTLQELLEAPVARNSRLGHYTNFMNLLDLAAVAIPAGFLESGLPYGVTVFGSWGSDRALLQLAEMHRAALAGDAATALYPESEDWVELVVCGAHLSGCVLNHQLTERGAHLICATQTSPDYRLFALQSGPVPRPALVRSEGCGSIVQVEVWVLPASQLGSFMRGIPTPLAIGQVQLADGEWAQGFVCESGGAEGAAEITHLGSWRAYLDATG